MTGVIPKGIAPSITRRRDRVLLLQVAMLAGLSPLAWAQGRADISEPTRSSSESSSAVYQGSRRLQSDFVALPTTAPIRRVIADESGLRQAESVPLPLGNIIYSHTRGASMLRPRAGRMVADELITTALVDCDLAAYSVVVSGGGDGTGDGFGLDLVLYEGCPGAGGRRIVRTGWVIELPDDGLFEIVVDMTHAPPTIPSTVWISGTFTTNRAGWAIGVPPEVGYSDDAYFHPFTGCNTFLGGFPRFPHASFHAQLFAAQECEPQYIAHRSFSRSTQTFFEGVGVTIADDVSLSGRPCELGALELGMIGLGGPYSMEVELRFDGPGDPIAGTRRLFHGRGDGSLEFARFNYDPGLALPDRFWVSATPFSEGAGVALGNRMKVGSSEDFYAVLRNDLNQAGWVFRDAAGTADANFNLSIYCRGSAPIGACCMENSGDGEFSCEDAMTEVGCVGRWVEALLCADEGFDPPCGATACCLPDDACLDLPPAGCEAIGGVSQAHVLCDNEHLHCPVFACQNATGDCHATHESPACNDLVCCDEVCTQDPWCCNVGWDDLCVAGAEQICPLGVKSTRGRR